MYYDDKDVIHVVILHPTINVQRQRIGIPKRLVTTVFKVYADDAVWCYTLFFQVIDKQIE